MYSHDMVKKHGPLPIKKSGDIHQMIANNFGIDCPTIGFD